MTLLIFHILISSLKDFFCKYFYYFWYISPSQPAVRACSHKDEPAVVALRRAGREDQHVDHTSCDRVIDIAHGHTLQCKEAIININKLIEMKQKNVDIIAGNVCTAEDTKFLIEAGVYSIKVNIGAGSICTTKIVSGCCVRQFTAVIDCANEEKKYYRRIRIFIFLIYHFIVV